MHARDTTGEGPWKRSKPRVVDRHDEVVGRTARPDAGLREDPVEVELTDPMRDLLDVDRRSVTLPPEWVGGVRRDEIRLTLGTRDPAFRSGLEPAAGAPPDDAGT